MKMAQLATTFGYTYKFDPAAPDRQAGQRNKEQNVRPHGIRFWKRPESTTTRTAGGLDFTAIGGKRQGHGVPQSLRVESGTRHPVLKTQSGENLMLTNCVYMI